MACPTNSIKYNGTQCACPAGQLLNRTTNRCGIFAVSSEILTGTGAEYYALPETFFSFESIRKFTQSQAVFLEATAILLFSWLFFCLFLRFVKLGDGRSMWFKIRWWISRLDVCFSTRHWLDDQKVVRKKKTELGGTFSMASWILFIGFFAALLYQVIFKGSIEVHNVRATNAPDLASFINDMEFNITTVSSMSCSNLRGLGTLVTGDPGFTVSGVDSLTNFMSYSCQNSSSGPIITLKCNDCRLIHDYQYISWQFVDLPGNPAVAVGFQFNFTSNNHANKKHVSFVSGLLKNGSTFDDRPVTFRGVDANILKFNFFPRIYHNKHSLRLIQPLFHEFVPGSSYLETPQLQASLERSSDGLINTTLFVNYLSAYVVEVDDESIMGPVSFLANLGGLYCISIGIFFYLLVQCEYRIKKLRNEDSIMRKIRNRRKAQEHWDKLRKYVMYTWGDAAEDDFIAKKSSKLSNKMGPSVDGNRSIHGSGLLKKQNKMDTGGFKQKLSLSVEKNVKTQVTGLKNDGKKPFDGSGGSHASQSQTFSASDDSDIPLPPPLAFKVGSEVELFDIQKNLEELYEYNVMLREKLITTQSLVHALAGKNTPPAAEHQRKSRSTVDGSAP